ncbi:glycosyltransferase [Actinomyces oris]
MTDLQILSNLALLSTSAARQLVEDPVLLALQGARRLSEPWRSRGARALGIGAGEHELRLALSAFIADRADSASDALSRAVPRSALGRRLAAEMAIHLGSAERRHLDADGLSPAVRARDLWSRGHLSAALSTLEGAPGSGALRARLRSQLAMMSPGFHLPRLSPSPGWTAPDPGEPLRVLHLLTSSLPRTQSGYTVRSHALLQAQSDAGIDVRAVTRIGYPVIIGRPAAQATDVVDAVTYRRLLPARTQAAPIARLAQMSRLLAREVEAFRPHLLHTTTNYVNALVAQAVARSFGLPWVYEMRGVLECTWVASRPVSQQAEALGSERFALLRAKETEMARRADAVVVLSQVQAEDLAARGVEPGRITVVPNAVEQDVLEATRYSPADARQRLGLPPEGLWVGSVSSLVGYEGFDVLLRAVALCRARGVDVRCAVVGDGVSRPGLVALAGELGLEASVCVLPGRVERTRALDWYQALDVFCVPRLDTPVCRLVTPLKPMTAMALGRPVVVSDLPALSELTAAATNRSFPAGDVEALSRVLTDMAAGETLPSTPSTHQMLPTWSGNAVRQAEIYKELV